MITRSENGKLKINNLDLEIFIGDLLYICKNERELEWIRENIQGALELCADERYQELLKENG